MKGYEFMLTVAMGKRLIAKGLLADEQFKNALREKKVLIVAGTTNAYVAEEVLAFLGEKYPYDMRLFRRGITVAPGAKVTPGTAEGDVLIDHGKAVFGKDVFELAPDMQAGDVLLAINGVPFHTPADLQLYLSRQQAGQRLHPVLLRNGKKVFCSATLRARPQPVVVGYARPVNHAGVREGLLALQCRLAYHLAQCPHSQQEARQCAADIRRFMAISPQTSLRLSYRDSVGPISIDCKATHFSIRAGEHSLRLDSSQDELPPHLRERLIRLSRKN